MYGAYHHITVAGKEEWPHSCLYDVTGSLCENNDKFAVDRKLPEIIPGTSWLFMIPARTGMPWASITTKLRPAELLLKPDGKVEMIRRAETIEDYFATLDFSKL